MTKTHKLVIRRLQEESAMTHLIDIAITPSTLRRFYPLNGMDELSLKEVNKHARLDNLGMHEILFREGSDDADVIYLLKGSIKLTSENGASFILDADSDQALYPIANIKPRKFSAYVFAEHAAIARIPSRILEGHLHRQSKNTRVVGNTITHEENSRVLDSDWMMAMKRTPLFQKLQEEYITQLFHVMEEKNYRSGERVVIQGEEGDYYYMIKEGKCIVSRNNGQKDIVLAELGPTASFGEEALLTRSRRNATVTMATNGVLMRISKLDFEQFMQQPVIQWVNPVEAGDLLKNGAIPVDVRKDAEKHTTFKQAIRIPSYMLRNQLKTLSRSKRYVLLCDDSRDSALASYLFSQRGLDSYILRNTSPSAMHH
jgi:CRP-like cAMP-binding protein